MRNACIFIDKYAMLRQIVIFKFKFKFVLCKLSFQFGSQQTSHINKVFVLYNVLTFIYKIHSKRTIELFKNNYIFLF